MQRNLAALVFFLLGSTAYAQQPTAPPAAAPFVHQGAARDATRYETQTKAALPAQMQGRRAREIRAAGEKLLVADPRAASKQLGFAAALDPADAEGWLALSRALLLIKGDENTPDRFEILVQAGASAYLAYQRAPNSTMKARALDALGEAFRRRSFWRPAIDALQASLALADNAAVRQSYEKLRG